MTDFLDDKDDEVFFEVGAALRSRDEQIGRRLEGIAGGEDIAEVTDSLGALEERSAQELAAMEKLAAPLGEDFLSSLGDLAVRETQAAPAHAVTDTGPGEVVSLATWRTRSWRAGSGALAVAASLVLLFMAGDDEDAWKAHYELELVNAPEVARGAGDDDGEAATSSSLSISSSGLAEWVLRPNEVVTTTPEFGAFVRGSSRGAVAYVGEPCIRHQVSNSGAVHVELNLSDCAWAEAGGSYELQFVVGPPSNIARKREGQAGVDGMSALHVTVDVTDG